MVPTAYVVLETFPLTPSGKIDRKALPAPEAGAAPELGDDAPQGEVEQALAAIWCQVLGLERVGRHANFFALGGHSLLAIRAISRIAQTFQVKLTMQALFERQTIADVAKYINVLLWASQTPASTPDIDEADLEEGEL
jgi:acyl carrier protein